MMLVGVLVWLSLCQAWAGSFLDNLQVTAADEDDQVTDLGDTLHVRTKRQTQEGTLEEEICKYKKGTWSECDALTKLLTRLDNLKPGMSEKCEATRQVTKKCAKPNKAERRSNKNKERVACKYQKGKDVEFGPCQDTGVKTKKLSLVSAAVSEHCPEVKIISKRCKNGGKKKAAKKKEKIEKQKARQEKKEKKKEERKAQKEQRKVLKEKRKAKKEKIEKKKVNQQPKKNSADDKCEFGDWEEWGPCTQGSQKRNRMIKSGEKRKKCIKKSTEKRKCSTV